MPPIHWHSCTQGNHRRAHGLHTNHAADPLAEPHQWFARRARHLAPTMPPIRWQSCTHGLPAALDTCTPTTPPIQCHSCTNGLTRRARQLAPTMPPIRCTAAPPVCPAALHAWHQPQQKEPGRGESLPHIDGE